MCLQSPSHGVQQLAGFNPAMGDVIGVDDILELSTAQTDLSDVAVAALVADGGMKYIPDAMSWAPSRPRSRS